MAATSRFSAAFRVGDDGWRIQLCHLLPARVRALLLLRGGLAGRYLEYSLATSLSSTGPASSRSLRTAIRKGSTVTISCPERNGPDRCDLLHVHGHHRRNALARRASGGAEPEQWTGGDPFESIDPQDLELEVVNSLGQVVFEERRTRFTGIYRNTLDLSVNGSGVAC